MSLIELFLIAVGLSMDAFAVAVSAGLSMGKIRLRDALVVGIYFGTFQALMPLIGFLLASFFSDKIVAFDHWVAFILLAAIGGNMIYGSLSKKADKDEKPLSSLRPAKMLPLAIATSIDALAAGVSFAFLQVTIVPAVIFIGVITLLLSMIGVKVGTVFGLRFKAKAEFAGGVILILLGLKILLEHTGVIAF